MSGQRALKARAHYAGCSADWDLCDIFMDPPGAPEWLTKWRQTHAVPKDAGRRYRCYARFIRRTELRAGSNWKRFARVEISWDVW